MRLRAEGFAGPPFSIEWPYSIPATTAFLPRRATLELLCCRMQFSVDCMPGPNKIENTSSPGQEPRKDQFIAAAESGFPNWQQNFA